MQDIMGRFVFLYSFDDKVLRLGLTDEGRKELEKVDYIEDLLEDVVCSGEIYYCDQASMLGAVSHAPVLNYHSTTTVLDRHSDAPIIATEWEELEGDDEAIIVKQGWYYEDYMTSSTFNVWKKDPHCVVHWAKLPLSD